MSDLNSSSKKKRPNGYWTEALVREEALKYANKVDFERGCISACQIARKLGIIDELFKNQRTYWTEESVREKAKKYASKGDFKKAHNSAYNVARKLKIIDELFNNQLTYWAEESVREEALKYSCKKDFKRSCGSAYSAALKLKIIDELFENKYTYWAEESVREEAKKYSCKKDFSIGRVSAYQAALELGIIDELFENQPRYTDADAIYIWRVDNVLVRDKILVKVGITSKRIGDRRIKNCANTNGFVVADQHMFHASNAAEIEDTILGELIDTPEIGIKDGKTEFRLIERGEYEALVERILSLVKL